MRSLCFRIFLASVLFLEPVCAGVQSELAPSPMAPAVWMQQALMLPFVSIGSPDVRSGVIRMIPSSEGVTRGELFSVLISAVFTLSLSSLVLLAQDPAWFERMKQLIHELDDTDAVRRRQARNDLLDLGKGHESFLAHLLSRALDSISPSRPHAGKALIILMAELKDRIQAEARVNSYWVDYGARATIFQMAIRLAYVASFIDWTKSNEYYEKSFLTLTTNIQTLLKTWNGSDILSATPYEKDRDVAVGLIIGFVRSPFGKTMLQKQPRVFWSMVRRILNEAEAVETTDLSYPYGIELGTLARMTTPEETLRLFTRVPNTRASIAARKST